VTRGFVRRWVAKGREAPAKRIEQEHEDAGENDADGGEGHRGEITKSDFSGDEIKGPDSGEKNQREPDNRAAGGASRGGV
jgi:hypothetical protein